MTLPEFKKEVADSPAKGWLQTRTVNFNYPNLNYQVPLSGAPAIYDFLLKQIKGYENLGELPPELAAVKTYFENAKSALLRLVLEKREDESLWKKVIGVLTSPNYQIIPSDTPEAELLCKLFQSERQFYNGAYHFIIGNTPHIPKHDLNGYLIAYEHSNLGTSKIVERREHEKRQLAKLKNDLQRNLSESETEVTEYLSQAKESVNQKSKEIDDFLTDKKDGYKQWFDQTSGEIDSYFTRAQERISELEALYKEKLKLEAPAKYWSERANKLKEQGQNWLIGFIVCIAIGVGILLLVLNMIADGVLEQIFSSTATAIKWSVALVTLISFIAYAIKIISKLTFSSFHLARDAEEREQLTYVYLALKNEKGIDDTERHLIMQSLFSRADTGLLKDDGSPTMPGNIVDKFLSK